MPAEPAIADFLDVVRRSGIVPERELEQLLEEFRTRPDLDTSAKTADELVAREVLTRWQADKLLQGKYRNFVLGPYRIMRPLGRGGMGTVYLAQHSVMRRFCAIKVLPSRTPKDDSSMLDRFYREAQAVAALDHPNIVRAYDVNKEVQKNSVVHYLVMEYVEGQDLQAKVDEHGVLGYREAAQYVRQAAQGLAHAHEAGLVHRDVKPANLLVDSRGVVKILDLGLARFYDEGQGASLTNQFGDTVLGTVDYLAPEQALDCHDVDARADVYSLGQTLYFLLTGHPPFPEGSVAQRLMAHQTRSPEPIEHVRPDVPIELVTIYEGMTAKNPDDRYQTAGEVAEALSTWLSDRPGDSGFLPLAASLRPAPRLAGTSDPTRAIPRSARPSAHGEATRAGSSSLEDTDLELAPLDDEEPVPPPSGSGSGLTAKSASGSGIARKPGSGLGLTKGPDSGSGITEPPDKRSPTESGVTQAAGAAGTAPADSPAQPPEDAGPPEVAPDLSDLAPPETDWMSSLLEDESLPALDAEAAPATLPSLTRPEARKPDSAKREQGGPGALVRLPVFWVGVGGAVLTLVLIVILAVSLSTPGENAGGHTPTPTPRPESPAAPEPSDEPEASSPDREVERADMAEARPAEIPEAQPDDVPAKVDVAEGEEQAAPSGEVAPVAAAAGPRPAEPGDATGAARPPADREPTRPSRGAESLASPDGGRPRRYPVEPRAVPPAGQEHDGTPTARQPPHEGAQSVSADEPPPPPDPAELRARFAAISRISFQLKSADRNPTSKLNMLVKQQALQAAERAGLAVGTDPAVVMYITLETTDANGLVGFVLSAELKCREGESKELTLWKHQEQVATLSQHLLRKRILPTPLKTGVSDFFARFAHDHRKAQEQERGDEAPKADSGQGRAHE